MTPAALLGNGFVYMNDRQTAATALIINDRTISAFAPSTILGGPPVGRLWFNAFDVLATRIDLDGQLSVGDDAVINIFRNPAIGMNTRLHPP